MNTIQETKERLLKTLKEAKDDNERVHIDYDDYIKALAFVNQPELVIEADKLVEGIEFWYA